MVAQGCQRRPKVRSKNSIPRPRLRPHGTRRSPGFIVFLNDLKSRKVFVFQYFSMVLASQNLSFFDQFFIHFSLIFRIPSWRAFLIDFYENEAKRSPKGIPRDPKGDPMVSQGCQRRPKVRSKNSIPRPRFRLHGTIFHCFFE